MKNRKLIILISLALLFLTSFQFSKEKITPDPDYNSLLSIESAKKLYRKQHYEDALSHLLKVASITNKPRIKAEAIIEIAFVKFLMGYSSQTYQIFIKKALNLNKDLELSQNHSKSFKKVFKSIKRSYNPVNAKEQTFKQRIIQKPKQRSIRDMEIRNNLLFKMKKELSSLRETNNYQKERNEKQNTELSKQKKINSKNVSTINKLRRTISSLQKLRDKDYKKQYQIIKNEKLKIEKEIKEKDKIIAQLTNNIKKQKAEIKQPKEIKIEKSKNKEVNKLDKDLKINVFKTLHQIWEKSFL